MPKQARKQVDEYRAHGFIAQFGCSRAQAEKPDVLLQFCGYATELRGDQFYAHVDEETTLPIEYYFENATVYKREM